MRGACKGALSRARGVKGGAKRVASLSVMQLGWLYKYALFMCVIICFPRNPVAPPARRSPSSMCTSLLLRYSICAQTAVRTPFIPVQNGLLSTTATHWCRNSFPPLPPFQNLLPHKTTVLKPLSTATQPPKQWLLHIVTCIHPAIHSVHSKRSRAPPRTRVKCVVIALVRHTVVKLPEVLTH